MLLEGGNALGQKVEQHHQRRQARLHQEPDPLEHGIIGTLQLENLLLVGAPAHRVTSRQCQLVVYFGLYNHPVVPPMVQFVGAEGGDVRNHRLAPVLKVVGPQMACAAPEAHDTKKSQNRCTSGCTPTYISQRWTKTVTKAIVCGVR
jgi:hypothetical protein